MRSSWVYGAAVVIGVHAVWFALILSEARADWFMAAIILMFFVTMNVAGVGACLTAYKAPRRGFLLGISMAPLAALLATLSNLMLAALGTHVDFSGFRGNLGLFGISLAYGIFVSAVGGGIGRWMARKSPETVPGLTPPAGHI